MKIISKIANLIKENWKAMIFAIVYVFGFLMSIAFSFGINGSIKEDFSIFSLLLLLTALLSILAIIAKFLLNLFLKEKANDVANKSSLMVIIIGIFSVIAVIGSIVAAVSMHFSNPNEYEKVMLIFLVPAFFILLMLLGLFMFFITFIAFALLRFAIKYKKTIITLFLVSVTLWPFSLIFTNNAKEESNNPQVIFQNILDAANNPYDVYNTYFIHNDMIYAYMYSNEDEFFVMNLDGSNKRVILNSQEMRLAEFIYIDNNEAYYYTMYTNSIKKINLQTGYISTVYEFKENEGGGWYVQYDTAKEKLSEILPKYKKSLNGKYKLQIEGYEYTDENFLYNTDPENIIVTNMQNGKKIKYDNVMYCIIKNNILYMIRAEKIREDIYNYAENLKNIYVEKIILE